MNHMGNINHVLDVVSRVAGMMAAVIVALATPQ
ncbi:hypothetical protein EMIT07CA2_10236 [Brevibacillus sp. IT-7CA2]